MNLKTVKQFCESNEAFPTGSMRWLIYKQDSNGLLESGALIKLGGRILIDEDRFMQWVEAHNTATQNSPRVTRNYQDTLQEIQTGKSSREDLQE